ncbi:MAG TPA: ThuA domain-containing protein [Thermoanaerobaculia bacterium]|nr:ThuA domain-containing protein [Thermoanaerobaculia bacterium]
MRVLFLSKSSGFEHSSIKREGDRPSHVEQVLSALADQHGFGLEATKDAGRIRADVLSGFDVVVFYTTGDLTERGGEAERGLFAGDGEPPMGPNGLSDLLAWIRGGGGFVGFHCASDTFHSEEGHSEEGHSEEGSVSDYIAMLGGEFDSHGQQFEGLVRVVDADHPITSAAPRELIRLDEWYLFKNFDPERVHVLRVLDSRDEGERQPAYDREPYPIVWTREPGEGRVYYDAQGHREDVWDDPEFQDSVVRALRWAGGR